MTAFLWAVNAILLAQWLWVVWNMAGLPSLDGLADEARSGNGTKKEPPGSSGGALSEPGSVGGSAPSVSILIPARNEALNIEACLQSVLGQSFADMEVIVLDDRSEDNTATLVRPYADKDARLRLIGGEPTPPGWTGKAYACHQLAAAARAPWLFFLDADARLEPDALARFMLAAWAQGGGLLTGFPRQIVVTPLEKLVVPMMMYTVACHLPIRLVRGTPDPRFAAAHGACMLIRRDAYEAAGGHSAIRSQLVDDMELMRAVKRAGYPAVLADVHRTMYMRMYRSASEVWLGYRKNIFPGLGRSAALLGAILSLYAILYVVPVLLLLASFAGSAAGFASSAGWLIPSGAAYLLSAAIKAAIDVRNGLPARYGLLFPISVVCLTLIALDSWHKAHSGKGYVWKGRTYK